MAIGVNGIMTLVILALTPLGIWYFTRDHPESRTPIREIPHVLMEGSYWIHALTYLLMIQFKALTDNFNEPLKGVSGDYTQLLYAIEGKLTLYIQRAFENGILTDILNFHYLFIYLLIILFTTAYYIYCRDQEMADKAAMNYVLIYVLAVPYYLFFNVEVTSTFIPGMKALLYHDSATYFEFFTTHDPLDNAFPSLHMAIPMGLLLLNYLHLKDHGIPLKEWKHRKYHYFVLINTAIFAFSILYLGIHWIIDIATGFLLALIGALFVHALQPKLRALRAPRIPGQIREAVGHFSLQSLTVILLIGMLTFTLQYQADTHEERPNMQLGPQDTNVEIFEPVPEGESIRVRVLNLHPTIPVEGVLLDRSVGTANNAVQDGFVNWTQLSANQSVLTFNPNSSTELRIPGGEEMWWILLLHNTAPLPNTTEELDAIDPATIRVIADYPGNVVPQATLLSVPSLLITVYVLHRSVGLWAHRMPWYSSASHIDWHPATRRGPLASIDKEDSE